MARNRPKPGVKRTFADQQNADERSREHARRKQCTALHFWLVCGKPACRRKRGCAGDPAVCFSTHWPLVPEHFKAYWRGCIKAARTASSIEEMHRAGNAAREIYLKSLEFGSMTSTAQPERAPLPGTDARVRRV